MFNRIFRHSWKHYASAGAIGLVLTLLALLKNGFRQRIAYMDALTIAGAVLILLGLLLLVARLGAFDIFSYSFSLLGSDRHFHSLYDYSEAKNAKRHKTDWFFMTYIVVGLLFLAVGFLLKIGL